jgi:hypothetical protein
MAKWVVVKQDSGITDPMRISILSTLRTSIDTHGSLNMADICIDVKRWLDQTYGNYWCVIISKAGEWNTYFSYLEGKYLTVKETDLNWNITIFKQAG